MIGKAQKKKQVLHTLIELDIEKILIPIQIQN